MQQPQAVPGVGRREPVFFARVARMGHHPIVAMGGGVTTARDGQILGGIGGSGETADEDQEVCADALGARGYDLDFAAFNRVRTS